MCVSTAAIGLQTLWLSPKAPAQPSPDKPPGRGLRLQTAVAATSGDQDAPAKPGFSEMRFSRTSSHGGCWHQCPLAANRRDFNHPLKIGLPAAIGVARRHARFSRKAMPTGECNCLQSSVRIGTTFRAIVFHVMCMCLARLVSWRPQHVARVRTSLHIGVRALFHGWVPSS